MIWKRDLFIINSAEDFIEGHGDLEEILLEESGTKEVITFLNWLHKKIEKSEFHYSFEDYLAMKKPKDSKERDRFIIDKTLEYYQKRSAEVSKIIGKKSKLYKIAAKQIKNFSPGSWVKYLQYFNKVHGVTEDGASFYEVLDPSYKPEDQK